MNQSHQINNIILDMLLKSPQGGQPATGVKATFMVDNHNSDLFYDANQRSLFCEKSISNRLRSK